MFESLATMLLNALVGLIVGVIFVAIVTMTGKIRDRKSPRVQ
jgi:hypothetical protein